MDLQKWLSGMVHSFISVPESCQDVINEFEMCAMNAVRPPCTIVPPRQYETYPTKLLSAYRSSQKSLFQRRSMISKAMASERGPERPFNILVDDHQFETAGARTHWCILHFSIEQE